MKDIKVGDIVQTATGRMALVFHTDETKITVQDIRNGELRTLFRTECLVVEEACEYLKKRPTVDNLH